MGCEVYANNMAIACKSADGKTICAFPDPCFTPPQTPVTPPGVPIPYPNTAMAGDTTDGSKNVKINGKEVMLKNKSFLKKSMGNEAAMTPKKGLISGANHPPGAPDGAKAYFNSWSMNVKFESENVVRNLDITTNNHASPTPNTPPWPYIEKMSDSQAALCAKDKEKEEKACKDYMPYGDKDPCPPAPTSSLASKKFADKFADQMIEDRDGAAQCLAARRCSLQPYEAEKGGGGCCPGQTPHHLVEASAFHIKGRGDGPANMATGENVKLEGCDNYDMKKAPCICVEGAGHGVGTHGLMHTFQSAKAMKCEVSGFNNSNGSAAMVMTKNGLKPFSHPTTTLGEAQKSGANAVTQTFPESACNEACIEAQLKAYHESDPPKGAGMKSDQKIKAVYTCKPDAKRITEATAKVDERRAKFDAIDKSRQAPGGALI